MVLDLGRVLPWNDNSSRATVDDSDAAALDDKAPGEGDSEMANSDPPLESIDSTEREESSDTVEDPGDAASEDINIDWWAVEDGGGSGTNVVDSTDDDRTEELVDIEVVDKVEAENDYNIILVKVEINILKKLILLFKKSVQYFLRSKSVVTLLWYLLPYKSAYFQITLLNPDKMNFRIKK